VKENVPQIAHINLPATPATLKEMLVFRNILAVSAHAKGQLVQLLD
jgi:hypothetical protein